ncbi:tripartite motif-containing protein 16-like [Sinocyclocheilus grahami]|uniref:tripartite motif-containing protein 16-like n=1 Tax=Sinocyclocheilus grahami TaxID=75366 RepID=UPI0007AD118B|nr:PREDICTED: tripartite motif-containing protein 16-like [Sinocyclocheilus grahami]
MVSRFMGSLTHSSPLRVIVGGSVVCVAGDQRHQLIKRQLWCLLSLVILGWSSMKKPVNLSNVPEEYLDLKEVFSKSRAASLPPHRPYDCAIDLVPGTSPPKGKLYSLPVPEREKKPVNLSNVPEEYLDLKEVFSKSRAASLPPHRPYDCAIDLVPGSRKALQRFLGFANFYRHFIRNFSQLAAPVTALTSTKTMFRWSGAAEAAFTNLKSRFLSAPILIVYSPAERNYDICNRELLAVKLALEEWRHWLEGSGVPFIVWTDHKNLKYIRSAKRLNSRQARWALFFGRFDFTLSYRPGSKNIKPDALSRVFELSDRLSTPERKRHKVTDATGRLQQMICHQHDKLLELFCRTDQQCVCMLCAMDEHKNHETVSTAAERTEKEKHLKETQSELQQRIQQRQKDLEQLREAVEAHKRSAQTAVEDSERIFTELIRSIERSRSEVTQRIRDQEKTAVSRAEGQMERLEQEIEDLKKRNSELEQLSHTDDHIYFLQSLQSLSAPPEATENISVSFLFSFDAVRESVGQLRHKLEDFCKEEMKKISDTHSNIVPRTREDFLQYSHQFTLDPNTAHKLLRLSEGNRAVTYTDTPQPYPDHPDRFDNALQVLCRESVSGRCYWELEWSGSDVGISVSYKSISKKGSGYECVFGRNDQSWSLFCSPSSFSFWHNKSQTELPVPSSCRRIGVYVDHSAGTLCFYSVSDTMNLIHTVQTTFTQPLYPGFYVCGSVKLSDLTT